MTDADHLAPTYEQVQQVVGMWQGVIRAYREALRPVLAEAVKVWDAYVQALRDAGVMDDEGKPVRRRDRPAWQSPYGPPQKRGK